MTLQEKYDQAVQRFLMESHRLQRARHLLHEHGVKPDWPSFTTWDATIDAGYEDELAKIAKIAAKNRLP